MHPSASTPASPSQWNRPYEFKAVALLSTGFGLVGLDRFIINPLFPVMSKDLGLNYQDLGLISAVLALSWGISSIWTGRLSDRIGRKRVLVPAVVLFSLLVATSGLATGLISLLVIRALKGMAEGAYVPASIVATVEASKPTRIGLNVGLQQMAAGRGRGGGGIRCRDEGGRIGGGLCGAHAAACSSAMPLSVWACRVTWRVSSLMASMVMLRSGTGS